jgi:hypothetical protein
MRFLPAVTTLFTAILLTPTGHSAVSPGSPFYGDPPDQRHPWALHDRNRPQPVAVKAGTFSSPEQPGTPPADAVVLFDGTAASLAKWEADTQEGGPTKWIAKDGAMECVPKSGYIRTKQHFGDCQLHVEWAAPKIVQGDSQGRGNSGIFLMGLCEVQVLDNYNNPTYADGFAAAIYGASPPLANALRPPGEFQVIDIVFRRPIYDGDKVLDSGYITVFCNGVLVQDHTPLEGPTGHLARAKPCPFPAKGPLKLQDHGNPVRFRNIWCRELPARAIEGGTDGALTPEATLAMRRKIATAIRQDAATLTADPMARMLRLAESLVYEKEAVTAQQVDLLMAQYAAKVKSLSPAQVEENKAEILPVLQALRYLAKNNLVPADFGPKAELESAAKNAGWDMAKN